MPDNSKLFNDLSADIQDMVATELRAQHYDAYSVGDIAIALRKINPVIWYENDKYHIWEAHRNAFEKEIDLNQ